MLLNWMSENLEKMRCNKQLHILSIPKSATKFDLMSSFPKFWTWCLCNECFTQSSRQQNFSQEGGTKLWSFGWSAIDANSCRSCFGKQFCCCENEGSHHFLKNCQMPADAKWMTTFAFQFCNATTSSEKCEADWTSKKRLNIVKNCFVFVAGKMHDASTCMLNCLLLQTSSNLLTNSSWFMKTMAFNEQNTHFSIWGVSHGCVQHGAWWPTNLAAFSPEVHRENCDNVRPHDYPCYVVQK